MKKEDDPIMNELVYPIGEQDFAKIRNNKRVYVDKTALIYRLANQGDYYFLSRPRRFGKSLLLTTLKYYFEGRRELFEGLAINRLETEWKKHPVFLFDMSRDKNQSEDSLIKMIDWILRDYEDKYGITAMTDDTFANRLSTLIKVAHEQTGEPVVVLVDEYDASLLDVLDDNDKLEEMRNIMRGFYSPLKAMAAHLRFVMLTGITKFSQVSIFSELNNLNNISMLPQYDAICGITKDELLTQLRPGLENLARSENVPFDQALASLAEYYDGYHFSKGMTDIFNPFSLIKALQNENVEAYWFESGTPTWLIGQMRKFQAELPDLEAIEVPVSSFDRPTEKNESIVSLLYQSGYLTIKRYDQRREAYTLGIANKEVRKGLGEALTHYSSSFNAINNRDYLRTAYFDLEDHLIGVDVFMDKLDTFYRSIPYDVSNDNERHFQAVFYAAIAGFGADIMAEDRTSNGRADIVVRMPQDIYIVEMKYGKSVEEAMEQLHQKDYAAKFREDPRPVHLLGINIDRETRGVDAWRVETTKQVKLMSHE